MKSIEDDPSITPGSVVRSPLSLAAIKDSDTIFSSSTKTSPPPQTVNTDTSIPSLSNSTWSFNPPASTPSTFTRWIDISIGWNSDNWIGSSRAFSTKWFRLFVYFTFFCLKFCVVLSLRELSFVNEARRVLINSSRSHDSWELKLFLRLL